MKRALYVVKAGDVPYASQTLPRIKEYASRVGATLTVIDETYWRNDYPSYRNSWYSKSGQTYSRDTPIYHFLLFEALRASLNDNADRMMYIDLDVLIRRDAPDVFSAYPEGICLARDWNRTAKTHGFPEWVRSNFNKKHPDYIESYYNTGVILWGKDEARSLLSKAEDSGFVEGVFEQHMFNYLLVESGLHSEVVPLPHAWNFLPRTAADLRKSSHKHFVHFAGRSRWMLQPKTLTERIKKTLLVARVP